MKKAENATFSERRYHHGDLRRALIEAAEHELTEKGFEGFTLRGCAKRAGVSHAAPAYHFKDADALLSALAAEGFARLSKAVIDHQAATGATAREKLLAAGLGYVDFARKHPALLRLMFASTRPDHGSEELSSQADNAFALLVTSVQALREDGTGDAGAIEHDIAATWAMVHGLAELEISGRLKFLPELETDKRDETIAAIIRRSMP